MSRTTQVRQHQRRTAHGVTMVGTHNRAIPGGGTRNRARADDDFFAQNPHLAAGRQRLQGFHDEALRKAFFALQLAEARLHEIPAEDLRTPIKGHHDKAWMQNQLRDIRAHLDNIAAVIRGRVWPASTSAGQPR